MPGDITITRVERGFMLGRAIREYGSGPWWEYVKVVKTHEAAVREARELASQTSARVWLHDHGSYRIVPEDDGKQRQEAG